MMGARTLLIALLATGFACLQSGPALAAPEVGWWWNANESGRGFFIEMKGTQLFVAGYFYADDGRAAWAISGGAITDLDNYSGRLTQVKNGQTLFGPYQAPTPADLTDIGSISLHFTDDRHGTLTWPGGTVLIERQPFGAGDAVFQPSGWWWNEAESGRGFSIEVQGSMLDVAGFMYDGDGNPVWYLSSGPMTSPTHYSGSLLQIAGGQTIGGPYKKPPTVNPVGSIAIDFASLENGTITLSDTIPASAMDEPMKALVTIPITPQLPNPPLAALAANWGGTYSGTLIHDPPGAYPVTLTVVGDVTWIDAAAVPTNRIIFPTTATPSRPYLISGGTATIDLTGTAALEVMGQTVLCSLAGSDSASLAETFSYSYLLFEANGTVTGQIATIGLLQFLVAATCATPSGTVILSAIYQIGVNLPIHGRHRYNHSEGSDPIHTIEPNISAGATWNFSGLAGP